MGASLPPRLLATGGGAAPVGSGELSIQVLTWLVAWAGALALLHLLLALVRGRLPVALFCLLGAVASVVAGLWALWDTLIENSRRSVTTAALWWPGFALGFFVAGAVGAVGWAALTQGLTRLLRGPQPPAEG